MSTIAPNTPALFNYPGLAVEVVDVLAPYRLRGLDDEWVIRLANGSELATQAQHLTALDGPTLDAMTAGFLTALLWSDAQPLGMGDNGETGGLQGHEVSADLRAKARELCARFLAGSAEDIDVHMEVLGDPDGGHPGEYVGHTFYLDAAHHGVSFTDREVSFGNPDIPTEDAAKLNAALERLRIAAKGFGEVEHLDAYELADGTVDVG